MPEYFETFAAYITAHPVLSPVCSASITAFVGGVIALITIKKQRQTARENNSLSFEKDYKRCEFVRHAWDKILEKVIKNKLSFPVEKYADPEFARTDDAKAIRDILNEWERAANAINHKLYDDKFLYNAFGSTVLFLRSEFTPYIYARQKENSSYYKHFMRMSLRWRVYRDNQEPKDRKTKHEACICRKCKSL